VSISYSISLLDTSLERIDSINTDGDLRAIWKLSGRVENSGPVDLSSALVSLKIYRKESLKLVDEIRLNVAREIPAHSIASFSRSVQFLPPKTAWQWDLSGLNAIPEESDTNQIRSIALTGTHGRFPMIALPSRRHGGTGARRNV